MNLEYFRVTLDGDFPTFGSGRRSVFVRIGRVNVTMIDWCTLKTASMKIETWEGLRPSPEVPRSKALIRTTIGDLLKLPGYKKTEIVKEVLRWLR